MNYACEASSAGFAIIYLTYMSVRADMSPM